MKDKTDNSNLGDITQQVDEIIKDLWVSGVNNITEGNYIKCFNDLQAIFFAINPYDFALKEKLETKTQELQSLVFQLNGNDRSTEKKRNDYAQFMSQLPLHLKDYLNIITLSLASLGKWMRVYTKFNDLDLKFSKDSFGTTETLLEEKKNFLQGLEKEEMLYYFSETSISNAYERYMLQNGR